jgi:hypothetical protein
MSTSSSYPQMFRVRQHFERPRIDDIPAAVAQQLKQLDLGQTIKPGQSVAISVGSRGIANIHIIVKAIADHLKTLSAEPFLVPAMGSHGGGIAEEQRKIIESSGVTEAFTGCPIRASMETVVVGETDSGVPVHFDRYAYEADHVLVAGRVKPHTGFAGDIESGLLKMMMIGLGKHSGAKIYHRAINESSFGKIVREVAAQVLAKCSIVAGVAIVENGYDETAKIAAVHPADFETREKELLVQAKLWMPRLPFKQADLLIIDEFGKNISGSGMDTNVIGRKFLKHEAAEHEFPKIRQILVRSLTRETHGNAAGIGGAEFCSKRVLEQIDLNSTRINCLTGGSIASAMIPVSLDCERDIVDVSLNFGLTKPQNCGVMWIKNTLQVAEVECSAAYLEQARGRDDLDILTGLRPIEWDSHDNLLSFQPLMDAHAA